jgi:hypothetical protein
MQLKNYYRSCSHRLGFRLYHLLHHLLSHVLTSRRNQLRNSKWVSFLGTLHPQAQIFWKIARYFTAPTRSVPPLFDHGVQVLISASKAELLAQHFERILHLNLNVGTANHKRMVNRTVNKYFRRLHPHVSETQLKKPYELRRLIQSLKTEPAMGTEGISVTLLWNLSRKALIHLTQLFNYILRFGYFSYAWKSAKVIPILKPGKPLSDTGSHRHISLFSTSSKLLERVLTHRLNSFIHQNHIRPPEQFVFPTCQNRWLYYPWL